MFKEINRKLYQDTPSGDKRIGKLGFLLTKTDVDDNHIMVDVDKIGEAEPISSIRFPVLNAIQDVHPLFDSMVFFEIGDDYLLTPSEQCIVANFLLEYTGHPLKLELFNAIAKSDEHNDFAYDALKNIIKFVEKHEAFKTDYHDIL